MQKLQHFYSLSALAAQLQYRLFSKIWTSARGIVSRLIGHVWLLGLALTSAGRSWVNAGIVAGSERNLRINGSTTFRDSC